MGCDIRVSVCAMRSSESRLRNGDCSSCDDKPWRSVLSKIGSPVVLVNSARTMLSFSVRRGVERTRTKKKPAMAATTTTTAAASGHGLLLFGFGVTGTATPTLLDDADGVTAGAEAERARGVFVDLPEDSSGAAIDPEPLCTPRRDSDSRFSRFRSARISDALW